MDPEKALPIVMQECEKAGVTIGPVYNMEDISQDPHVKERRSIREVRDPVTGKALSFPSNPIKLRPGSPEVQFPGLPTGAANEFVLTGILGYAREEVAQMKAEGAI